MKMSHHSGTEDESDKMSVDYFLLGLICEGWGKNTEGCSWDLRRRVHGVQGAFKYMEEIWAWLWAMVKKQIEEIE